MFSEQQASPQLRSGKAARFSVQPSSQDAAKQSASTENTGQIEVTALEPTQSVFFSALGKADWPPMRFLAVAPFTYLPTSQPLAAGS